MTEGGTAFGRFTLLRRLGAGGMGEVHLARAMGPAGFEKPLVLKRLLPQFAGDRPFVEMFLDEARLAARLHHPNITQIFELGEVDGGLYIAMEYVPGTPLERLQREARVRSSRPPLAAALRVAVELLGALEYAHGLTDEHGRRIELVHRDVSPTNVMITPHGGVKLLDFGLAIAKVQEHKSEAGVLKGKFGYMAPEQFTGARADCRADLFAAGAILYSLVTGGPAYEGEGPQTLEAMMSGRIVPPRSREPALSAGLEAILLRALARFPEDRYPSAQAFRADLERFAASERCVPSAAELAAWAQPLFPPEAAPAEPSGAPAGSFARHTQPQGSLPTVQSRPPRQGSRRAGAWIALGAAALGAAALGAWRLAPFSPNAPPPGEPARDLVPAAPPLARATPPPAPAPAAPAPAPRPPRAAHASAAKRPAPEPAAPAPASHELEEGVADLQRLYAALRRSGGEEGLTGLEREAYRAALDAYASFRTGGSSEAELRRALADGSRILRSGATRRGLDLAAEPGHP